MRATITSTILSYISWVFGRPRAKPPQNRANKLPTQLKVPYTSSKCKILDFISKPLTFAGNSAVFGAVWGLGAYFAPTFGKEKVHF